MNKQVGLRTVETLTGELAREFKTIVAMTEIYCRDHHGGLSDLCSGCRAFRNFAEYRLSKCPYGQNKPTCKHCPVHCYKKDMKDLAQTIMIYSGPRMLLKHPYLAIRHLLHDMRAVPELPQQRKNEADEEAVKIDEQKASH